MTISENNFESIYLIPLKYDYSHRDRIYQKLSLKLILCAILDITEIL